MSALLYPCYRCRKPDTVDIPRRYCTDCRGNTWRKKPVERAPYDLAREDIVRQYGEPLVLEAEGIVPGSTKASQRPELIQIADALYTRTLYFANIEPQSVQLARLVAAQRVAQDRKRAARKAKELAA